MAERQRTRTSSFGAGKREAHDASDFYARFHPPVVSDDDTVTVAPHLGDGCILGDARKMDELPDNCVALIVTSPPYFAGKEYESEIGAEGIPGTYIEYLEMLRDVFAECVRVLEPGGRIAVNVANLGRKPYRSLSSDVIRILQDDLGLLLRGEVVWRKARGMSGSCAWGSFRSASNPVLRDTTERIVIASKGRFDRARSEQVRTSEGLPTGSTISTDEFLDATLDVWEIPSESAQRIGHPAPFPIALPERLINLYTYEGDLVLDPFMGSGTTLVAATRTGRRGVGYELDESYIAIARERLSEPLEDRLEPYDKKILDVALASLINAGFTIEGTNRRVSGVTVPIVAVDSAGKTWFVDVSGGFTVAPGGLATTDGLLRSLGKSAVLDSPHVLLLTSHLPQPATEAGRLLEEARGRLFAEALELSDGSTPVRLRALASTTMHA
jgi:DNA modification methylase